MTTLSTNRVAAIALDAAEWRVVDRLMRAGHLPHLRALAERSARCRLRNVTAYRSERAWAQFLTGRSGDSLRWFGHECFEPRTYDTFQRRTLDAVPFYALGPERKVIALDLIHSIIADGVVGEQLTAWGAHSPKYPRASRPPGLLTEVDHRFGTNPAFHNDFYIGWWEPDYIENLTRAAAIGAGRRMEIAEWLMERTPDWDLLLICVSEIHSGAHHLWHGVDERHPLYGQAPTGEMAGAKMIEMFRAVDDAVGRLVAQLPADTTVVVFALHGMRPGDDVPAMVALPELAHRLQRSKTWFRDPDQDAWRRAGYPPVVPGRREHWTGSVRPRFTAGPRDVLRHAFQRLPAPAQSFGRRLARRPEPPPLGELAHRTPPETDLTAPGALEWRESFASQPAAWYRRSWPRMPWFALPTFADAHVRLNVEGREANGLIEQADYRRACKEVARTIARCRDPRTGRPAVDEVLFVRADDPLSPDGPDADLLVVWADGFDALEHPEVGIVGPFPHLRTGGHSSNGFALLSGPGIPSGDHGERPARDLTPTILELAGCDIPDHVEGTSILSRSRHEIGG